MKKPYFEDADVIKKVFGNDSPQFYGEEKVKEISNLQELIKAVLAEVKKDPELKHDIEFYSKGQKESFEKFLNNNLEHSPKTVAEYIKDLKSGEITINQIAGDAVSIWYGDDLYSEYVDYLDKHPLKRYRVQRGYEKHEEKSAKKLEKEERKAARDFYR